MEWAWQGSICIGRSSSKKRRRKKVKIHTLGSEQKDSHWRDLWQIGLLFQLLLPVIHPNFSVLEICIITPSGWKIYIHPTELGLASLSEAGRDFRNAFLVWFSLLLFYDHQLEACSTVTNGPRIIKTHKADLNNTESPKQSHSTCLLDPWARHFLKLLVFESMGSLLFRKKIDRKSVV